MDNQIDGQLRISEKVIITYKPNTCSHKFEGFQSNFRLTLPDIPRAPN